MALKHPHRVKAANELAESQRPCLMSKTAEELYQNFIKALEGIANYIPAKAIQNRINIFGGSDMLRAIVYKDISVISSSENRKSALIIPVPDMERFNPKPAFGGRTGVWCTGPLLRRLPQSSPKVSSDQQIGNEMMILHHFHVPTSDIRNFQHCPTNQSQRHGDPGVG